jgi:hypothetical protein
VSAGISASQLAACAGLINEVNMKTT